MNKNFLYLCLIKSTFKKLSNSKLEIEWAKKLSANRAKEYLFTRGHTRNFLSKIYGIPPLDVPLHSPPGKVPLLKNNLGYLSISHCKTSCLIGCSNYPIGVDIEIRNRDFLAKEILKKFYSSEEKSFLLKNYSNNLKDKVLDYWLIKESSFKINGGNLISELNNLVVNQKNNTVFNKRLQSSNKYFLITFLEWKCAVSFDTSMNPKDPLICYLN